MARYRGPVTKISRRLGVMLFTNGESKIKAFKKRPYKPGMHGQKRAGSISEYAKQLNEKQKARFMYGISEKQSKKYFDIAKKSADITGEKYLRVLETRIDNVIYQSGLARTRAQARQMVSHGLMTLNGEKIKTPSILVKTGDKFEVKENKKQSNLFNDLESDRQPPRWISTDLKKLAGEVLDLPEKEDIPNFIDSQLIVEFYSKA